MTRGAEGEGDTVELGTSEVSVGFNMQALPSVLPGGIVQLQYNISSSELSGAVDGFDVFEMAGQRVQLKNISNRSFGQTVEIPNGATLVLSGFEQVRSTVSKSGTGVADLPLFGGGQEGNMRREIMVILITPVLLDASKAVVEFNGN